jgi:AraC-like DNA-binding protein
MLPQQLMKPISEMPSPLVRSEPVVCELVTGADFGCVLHHHPQCEITIVRKGGTVRVVGDKITELAAGDMVFLGPNVPHDYRNSTDGGKLGPPVEAIVVQFDVDLPGMMHSDVHDLPSLQPVERLLKRASHGLEVVGHTREVATAFVEQMLEVQGMKRVILLLQLIDLLADSFETVEICALAAEQEPRSLTASDRISTVCAYIESFYAEPIYVEQLATMVGLGKSAFSRLFKKRTGRSVPQFVNGVRVAHACRLLVDTDLTVSQISRECGFISPAHFQRQFREQQQCSPLAYRARICQTL